MSAAADLSKNFTLCDVRVWAGIILNLKLN